MRRPPSLTPREKEVLPLLVRGATRTAIAQVLGISDETAKIHIRNIVEKFDAASVRDGISEFHEYLETFSTLGLGFEYFVNELNFSVEILEDLDMARLREEIDLTTVAETLERFEELFMTSGNISECRLDGQVVTPVKTSGNTDYYEKRFDPALTDGEQAKFCYEIDFTNPYNDPENFFSSLILHPTAEAKLTVIFPPNRIPSKIWAEGRVSATPLAAAPTGLVCKDNVATLTLHEPKIGQEFFIHWHWD